MNSKVMQALLCLAMVVASSLGDELMGGWRELDADDDEVFREALEETFDSLKGHLRSNGFVKLGHVTNAFKQVVSGMKYKADVNIDFKECQGASCHVMKTQKCAVVIWRRPSQEGTELLSHDCQKPVIPALRANRAMGGTFSVDDLESDIIKGATRIALDHLRSSVNSPVELASERVIQATTQVVAGTNLRLVVEFDVVNRLGSEDAHKVTCYFYVHKSLSGGSEVKKHECDDDTFVV